MFRKILIATATATALASITASSVMAACGIHQGGNECDPIDSRPLVPWRATAPGGRYYTPPLRIIRCVDVFDRFGRFVGRVCG